MVYKNGRGNVHDSLMLHVNMNIAKRKREKILLFKKKTEKCEQGLQPRPGVLLLCSLAEKSPWTRSRSLISGVDLPPWNLC